MTTTVSHLADHLDVDACEALLRKSRTASQHSLSLLDRASLLLAGQATRLGDAPAKTDSKAARLRRALPRTSPAVQCAAQTLSQTGLFGLFGFVPSNIGTVIWRGLTDSGYEVTWRWDDCTEWSNKQWLWFSANRSWIHFELIHKDTRIDAIKVLRRIADFEYMLAKECTVYFARETYDYTFVESLYEFTKAAEILGVTSDKTKAIIAELESKKSPAPSHGGKESWFTRLRRWLAGM